VRLGLVGPLPPPNGGMAMQTLQLARLLTVDGVAVELLQSNAPYSPAFAGKIKGLRALFRLVPYLWRVWRLAGRTDVIHLMANSGWSWTLFAAPVIWVGWLRGTPVIVNYRGGEAKEYLGNSTRWVRFSMSRAAHLVVPSGFLRQVFGEVGMAATVIPNSIDLEMFFPAVHSPAGSAFTLAITRNLEPIYGLDTAIHALALARKQIPGIQLKIAGSGPQDVELKRLVEQLGLTDSVTFLGRLERHEVVALYHSAHAMLNPSRVDNMPNSVLEALACGLPVVSTNVGGIPFIVEDGETALLVPPDDPGQMAKALVRLCTDTALRTRLRESGCRVVRQYAWREVGPRWLSLYETCRMPA
jgi:glycosyltransferase involved in cell wall biosynthesis